MNDESMKNKFRIELEDDLGHVHVNGDRYSIYDAADIFRVRMLSTMQGMAIGKVSQAIELTVEEVKPKK